ncbi:MAG TPA: metallopeptidase family protein [Candidatus Eisenbacteria bacterium]|nr:metallopeptidase family protein [Candidatus Eisenbacteria bacterium]
MTESDPASERVEEGEEALDEDDLVRALQCFDEALRLDPEHYGAALDRAETLHLMWRTEEALQAALAVAPPPDEEDDPDRVDLEGRIREAAGDFERADALFRLAHELEPSEFHLPIRTGEKDFRAILDKVLEALPPVIRDALLEVPVVVEPKPTIAIADREPHITPDVLGLFVGTSVGDKMQVTDTPNVVFLFQRNLERAGRSRAEVAKEIKITLLHEYGHYLGFDEEDMEHLGLA